MRAPQFIEILGKILNLDDSNVLKEIEEKLSEGKIILGYYDPPTKEIDVHILLEPNDYVKKRLKEVFSGQ